MIQPKTTLFSFLLCLFTGASAQTTHYDFKDGDLFYRILSPRDSTVEVAGGDATFRGITVIPDRVTHGDTAYYVVSVGENALKGNQYRSGIQFGKHLRVIKPYAFAQQPSLASVKLPDHIETIGKAAFYACSHLTEIEIGNGIDSIPESAFYGSAASSITLGNKVRWIGKEAFIGQSGRLKSLSLPESVKYVDESAFSGHRYLTSLNLGAVEEIGKNAFGNLTSLQKLHIPSSVKVIHGNPFSYDAALSSIMVDTENTVFDSRNACNAIINSTTNVAVSCCPGTQLPEGVTGLGEDALTLGGASKMFTLNLPSTLTFIAKSNLPRMDKVVIPNLRQWFNIRFGINPLRSAHRLFVQDEEVTEVEVPEDVEALNSSCFDGMSNLKSVKLHRGIKDIGGNAFQGCNALKTLECSWKNPPQILFTIFDNNHYNTVTLLVPFGCAANYKQISPWRLFQQINEMSEVSGIETPTNADKGSQRLYNLKGIAVKGTGHHGIVVTESGEKIWQK